MSFIQVVSSIALAIFPFIAFVFYFKRTSKYFKLNEKEDILFLDYFLLIALPIGFYYLFEGVICYPNLFFLAYIIFYLAFNFYLSLRSLPSVPDMIQDYDKEPIFRQKNKSKDTK